MSAAAASAPVAPAFSRRRVLRLAVAGLLAGAVLGFVGALLRPRSWVPYVEPRAATRT